MGKATVPGPRPQSRNPYEVSNMREQFDGQQSQETSGNAQARNINHTSTKEGDKSSKKTAGPARMVRQIASYNKPPPMENQTPLNGLGPYLVGIHNTRQNVQNMDKLASNLLEEAKSEDQKPKRKSVASSGSAKRKVRKSVASARPAKDTLPIIAPEEEAEHGNVGSIPEAEIPTLEDEADDGDLGNVPEEEAEHGNVGSIPEAEIPTPEDEADDGDLGNVPEAESIMPPNLLQSRQNPASLETETETNDQLRKDQRRKFEGDRDWKIWRARKSEIQELLEDQNDKEWTKDLSNYSRERRRDDMLGAILMRQSIHVDYQDLNMSMKDGICVFSPSANTIHYGFGDFLAKVEKTVGINVGFAKVILPVELKSKYTIPNFDETDALIRPNKTKLDLHAPLTRGLSTYGVTTVGETRVLLSEWQGWIQISRSKFIVSWALDERFIGDVYKEVLSTRSEEQMIAQSQASHDEMFYAESVQESKEVRDALHIRGPCLRKFVGNKLQEFEFKKLEMDRAVFQFSGAEGSPFGLQMTDWGAYSLNYLHRGAPKHWTIVGPAEHKKLEEFMHEHVEFAAGRLVKRNESLEPPTHAPQCDRFLWHQRLYAPKETLTAQGISHAEVLQYEGELIVTFPFTYFQGFNTGPNLAETIAYGNARWEEIHNSRLYQGCRWEEIHHSVLYQGCHSDCSGAKTKDPVDPGRTDF